MPEQRNENFDKIRRNGAFDVVVLGGGINGIGAFRDLALQGLRVLLVERNDFCSGCSAAPSRMIHGGLRYLENGEFGLVQESLRERDALLTNAPHMVKPLATTIPIRSVFSGLLNGAANFLGLSEKPASRGALAIKTGLALYDWTTRRRRVLPAHTFRSGRQTLAEWPELDPKLKFSATYYDAWISFPERLGVELLLDTARLSPDSVSVNYAELSRESGMLSVTDKETGERLPISARAIVNATGAWLDQSISDLSGGKRTTPLVEGTKGSHLVLSSEPLHRALNGHMIFFENSDGRVCIVFPYLGKVLAGSTDIRVKTAERVRCEPEEQGYILDALSCVFPEVEVNASHVVYSYSGIRPLPKSDHTFTGRISRGHLVHRIDGEMPQFCMIGGKWTTFRAFAEQTTDEVLAELGKPRVKSTIDMPIGGGADFSGNGEALIDDLVAEFGIDRPRAAHLVEAYGTGSRTVMEFCRTQRDDERLDDATEVTAAEIAFLAKQEFVVSLSDLLQRRTALAIKGQLSITLIDRVAEILARERQWSSERRSAEIERFLDELENYHGVSREMLDRKIKDRSLACA